MPSLERSTLRGLHAPRKTSGPHLSLSLVSPITYLLIYFEKVKSCCFKIPLLLGCLFSHELLALSLLKVPQSVVILWPSVSAVSRLLSRDISLDNKCFSSSTATYVPSLTHKKGSTTCRISFVENVFSKTYIKDSLSSETHNCIPTVPKNVHNPISHWRTEVVVGWIVTHICLPIPSRDS